MHSHQSAHPAHTHDIATPHRRRGDANYDKDYPPWSYAADGSYDHDANDEYDDGADNAQNATLRDEKDTLTAMLRLLRSMAASDDMKQHMLKLEHDIAQLGRDITACMGLPEQITSLEQAVASRLPTTEGRHIHIQHEQGR